YDPLGIETIAWDHSRQLDSSALPLPAAGPGPSAPQPMTQRAMGTASRWSRIAGASCKRQASGPTSSLQALPLRSGVAPRQGPATRLATCREHTAMELGCQRRSLLAQVARLGKLLAQSLERGAGARSVARLGPGAGDPHLRVVAQRRVGHVVPQELE